MGYDPSKDMVKQLKSIAATPRFEHQKRAVLNALNTIKGESK